MTRSDKEDVVINTSERDMIIISRVKQWLVLNVGKRKKRLYLLLILFEASFVSYTSFWLCHSDVVSIVFKLLYDTSPMNIRLVG